jgi:hypothetical protein
MLRGRMGRVCMLICIARRGILGMRLIGIAGRGERLLRGIHVWSGRGLCARCWIVKIVPLKRKCGGLSTALFTMRL